jgi:hypothetical protein
LKLQFLILLKYHAPSDLVFAVVNAFIVPSIYFFFPETAYRSLEEIDEIFAVSGWFSVVHTARPSVTPLVKHDDASPDAKASVATVKDDSFEEKQASS